MFHTCTQIFFTPDNIFFLNWMKSTDQQQFDLWSFAEFFLKHMNFKSDIDLSHHLISSCWEKPSRGPVKSAKVVEKL